MIFERARKKKAEVNIVPLVDVLTVLIFFFLLTMQFKNNYAVDITPPQMDSASPSVAKPAPTISISKEGKFFYNGELSDIVSLKAKISALGKENDPSLALLADKDAPFKHITAVIDLAKIAKIKKMSIQTQSK